MKEFQKSLPKDKRADALTKQLANIEASRINSYLVKSFATFTNPNYAPDQKIYNAAVDWVTKNVVKKNKDLRITAKNTFPKLDTEEAYKESGKMMVESVLRTCRS